MRRYPLYNEQSELWPIVSPPDDPPPASDEWAWEVQSFRQRRSKPLEVLDLGTGGGHHLLPLREAFGPNSRLTFVDLSKAMLEQAARRFPGATTVVGDMLDLDVGQRFDLALIHDSFCYLTERDELTRLAERLDTLVKGDGAVLIQLDLTRDSFYGPYRYLTTFETPDGEVSVLQYEWDPDPDDTWLEALYVFVLRQGSEVSVREERHRLGLFAESELFDIFEKRNFVAELVGLTPWDEERSSSMLKLTRATKGRSFEESR